MQLLQLWIFTAPHFARYAAELREAQVAAGQGPGMPQHAFEAQSSACMTHDALDRLGAIRVPTLLTVGDADPITASAIAWFWGIDPPNNTFPSTHVANACMAALGAWVSRHPVRWYSLLVAVGVFVTVHTAKQHYWVDAVGGAIVALVCFRLAFRLWPLPGVDVRIFPERDDRRMVAG